MTVLALLATSIALSEYQLFAHSDTAPVPVANDFGVYYAVGLIARSGQPEEIYSTPPYPTKAEQARRIMYGLTPPDTTLAKVVAQTTGTRSTYHAYPPFFAWAFSVFTHVKPRVAYFLWRGLSTLMLVFSAYLILRSFQPRVDVATFVVAIVGVLSFFPFSEVLFEGQVGCLVLFLWTLGFYFVRTGRAEFSAASFAAGTLVKITPAIVVPMMLLRRQWKWLWAYGGAVAVFVAVSLPRMGWKSYWAFATKVFPLISFGSEGQPLKSLGTVVRNLYLGRGIFSPTDPWQVPDAVRWFTSLANVAVLAGVLVYLYKKRDATAELLSQEFAIFALLSLMISPLTWRHHYVLAILPLLCAWMQSREASQGRLALLSLVTVVLGTPYSDFLLAHMHSGRLQAIASATFFVASAALLILCMQDQKQSSKLREEVYGDNTISYSPACK